MSVTFTIESNPTGAFRITCYDAEQGQVEVARADSYDGILVERAAHMLVCDECAHYGCYAEAVVDAPIDLDVNVANTNARMLLTILGVDAEGLTGTLDGGDFLGRVLVAMAEDHDDTGVRDYVDAQPCRATWVDCGLPAGYYAERFSALHALALEAARLGRAVTWA